MNNISLIDSISRVNLIFVKFVESNLIRLQNPTIKFTHYNILKLLFVYEKLSLKDISLLVFRHKSTVTVLIKKLVLEDYVKLSPCRVDKRKLFVTLTTKGKGFKSVVNSIDRKFMIYINNVYSVQEQHQVKYLLMKAIKKEF